MIRKRAFTLIELLIVIAIIGILSAIILVSYNNVREQSKISKAKADVSSIASANQMLFADTKSYMFGFNSQCNLKLDYYPNWTAVGSMVDGNPEFPVSYLTEEKYSWTNNNGPKYEPSEINTMGLLSDYSSSPAVYPNWAGPYIDQLPETDPWQRPYYVDADYFCNKNISGANDLACKGHDSTLPVVAIISTGPDVGSTGPDVGSTGSTNTWYGGDNISGLICRRN